MNISRFANIVLISLLALSYSSASEIQIENSIGQPAILITSTDLISPLAGYKITNIEFAFWKSGIAYCQQSKNKWFIRDKSNVERILNDIGHVVESIKKMSESDFQSRWVTFDVPYKTIRIQVDSTAYILESSYDRLPKDLHPKSDDYKQFVELWNKILHVQNLLCGDQ